MSDQHIENLNQKIDSAKNIFEDIIQLYKSIISNESYTQTEIQLKQINKAINNLQNRNTPVPDTLRELKTTLTNSLIIKEEADKIFKPFLAHIDTSIKLFSDHKDSGSNRLNREETLQVVVDVINLVTKNKLKPSKAALTVHRKHNISVQAVRNKCGRQINLTWETFREKLKTDPDYLKQHLLKLFPELSSFINKELG